MPRTPISFAFKALLFSSLGLGLGGCQMVRKLPNVKATSISTNTAVLGVHVSANATGVTNTGKTLKAQDATFELSWPGFSHTTTVREFEQKLPPDTTP